MNWQIFKYLFLVTIGINSICSLNGQHFQNLGHEFPFRNVRCITEDTYGFLWFGTESGVVKYDGYTFTQYHYRSNKTHLNAQFVEALYGSQDGGMWIGTRRSNGLEYYNHQTNSIKQFCLWDKENNQCFTTIDVYSIAEDHNKILWVGTSKGIFTRKINEGDTLRKVYQNDLINPNSISNNHGWNIYVDKQNTVWIGTMDGLNKFNRNSESFTNFNSNKAYLKGQILTIKENPDTDELWVSGRNTSDRIYKYLPIQNTYESIRDFDKMYHTYLNFDFGEDGWCWVASRGIGAFAFNAVSGEELFYDGLKGELHGLVDDRPQCIYVDQFQNIWIGGSQLLKKPNTNKNFQHIKGNGYKVLDIHAEDDYIIYSLNEPMIWDKKTKKQKSFWNFPSPRNIRFDIFKEDGAKLVWEYKKKNERTLIFTTTRNVHSYDLITKEMEDYPQDQGGIFLDFEFGINNDLIISEGNDYPIVFDFNSKEAKLEKTTNLSKALYATTMAKDLNGDIWMGTSTGKVYRYDLVKDSIEIYNLETQSDKNSVKASFVYDIMVHSNGDIWVATERGLLRMDTLGRTLNRLGREDGLKSELILSLLEDDFHNIWMGTGEGLAHYNIKENSIQIYTTQDGLINDIFTQSSCTKDNGGTLYFGGTQGVDYFKPEEINQNSIAPKLYLGSISVNNELYKRAEEFEGGKEITLDHTENFINIKLLGMHFTSPKNNCYAYKINDRDWINLGTKREISLANISPGVYEIWGKASNADNIWSEEKSVLKITILPPWWNSAWFYFLCGAVALIIGYLIYRYRINQMANREALQISFNKKLAEIEMKALRAQMNPHFIFNCLNSVKSLISKEQNLEATKYLTRFSQLIRAVLNNSRYKFVRLNDDLEALKLYLELEAMRFSDSFEYEIDIDKNVNADFLEVPALLMQPYVENAIWHGLMHKENGKRKLIIRIWKEGEMVKMEVEDNGIGRIASAKLHTRSSSKNESLGMKITEDRLNLLQEIYGGEASIQIFDLMEDGKGVGTRVLIVLPIAE